MDSVGRLAAIVTSVLLLVSLHHARAAPSGALWAAVRRPRQACEDTAAHLCTEELNAHYCYLEHNRNLCCRTCQSMRTNDPACPYGDHLTRINRKAADGQMKTYNCEGYIKFYGQHHCRVDRQFREYCCESCRGA
jgi:hypothetical protein